MRSEWKRRIADSLATLDLASEFEKAAQPYAELDASGRVVLRQPLHAAESCRLREPNVALCQAPDTRDARQ